MKRVNVRFFSSEVVPQRGINGNEIYHSLLPPIRLLPELFDGINFAGVFENLTFEYIIESNMFKLFLERTGYGIANREFEYPKHLEGKNPNFQQMNLNGFVIRRGNHDFAHGVRQAIYGYSLLRMHTHLNLTGWDLFHYFLSLYVCRMGRYDESEFGDFLDSNTHPDHRYTDRNGKEHHIAYLIRGRDLYNYIIEKANIPVPVSGIRDVCNRIMSTVYSDKINYGIGMYDANSVMLLQSIWNISHALDGLRLPKTLSNEHRGNKKDFTKVRNVFQNYKNLNIDVIYPLEAVYSLLEPLQQHFGDIKKITIKMCAIINECFEITGLAVDQMFVEDPEARINFYKYPYAKFIDIITHVNNFINNDNNDYVIPNIKISKRGKQKLKMMQQLHEMEVNDDHEMEMEVNDDHEMEMEVNDDIQPPPFPFNQPPPFPFNQIPENDDGMEFN